MTTIVEAIYEHGMLKPLEALKLKEHVRYRVIVEEIAVPDLPIDTALAAELERRTTTLPDGRKVVNLFGIFDSDANDLSFEEIEAILDESRQDQQREWDEFYGPAAEQ